MTSIGRGLRSAVEDAVGSAVVDDARVHGGDVAIAYRLSLGDGRVVFAKTHASPPPYFFSTEATGLRWMREAAAVLVPDVRAVSDGTPAFLVLEWIESGGATGRGQRSSERELGLQLATMHAAGAPSFGREDHRTTGSRALPNDPCATWAEFYADRRLRPLARLAADGGALSSIAIGQLEQVAAGLGRHGGADEPPARLHGDLWAGNRLVDRDGRSWLIDPAAHGGHREFDLAMMRLFGGFGAECFDAYHDVSPLADGWEQRIALHQIAPLVVHAIKFGGSYVPAAEAAIARYA